LLKIPRPLVSVGREQVNLILKEGSIASPVSHDGEPSGLKESQAL
jgi:hypothetical protein